MIDLNTADIQSVEALKRLKEPLGVGVLRLLEAEMGSALQKLVREGDTVKLHRLQGRAEAFEDLLRAVEDAPKVGRRSTP